MPSLRLSNRLGALAVLFALGAFGCGGGSTGPGVYTRSAYGTKGGYSFENVHATPASLIVAQKIDMPLYLVLDPAKVKDTWDMATTDCEIHGPRCELFRIFAVQTFVTRDLKNAFGQYFSRVEVVAPGQLPTTPHVVGDVKLDKLALHDTVAGFMTYTRIEMTWALGLRRSDQTKYSYSFAGVATSQDSYRTFEAGCGQLVENAINVMMKKWVEDDGVQRLGAPTNAALVGESASL